MKRMIKTMTVLFWLALLAGGRLSAAPADAWELYKEAARSFTAGEPIEHVIRQCARAHSGATDVVLYGRVSLLLSEAYLQQGQNGKAYKVLQELYSGQRDIPGPLADEARLRVANLYLAQGDRARASVLLRHVAEQSPSPIWHLEAALALAAIEADNQNWTQCDSMVTAVLSDQPAYAGDERVHLLRARSAIARNEAQTAIEVLRHAQSSAGLAWLAYAYELADKPIMAVGVYKKLHDRFQDTSEGKAALFLAGEVFMRAQDWLAARTQFEMLLKWHPESRFKTAVHYRLGWTYLKQSQYDAALAAFRQSGDSGVRVYFAFMQAECLRRLGEEDAGQHRQAILQYNSLMALAPRSPLAPLSKFQAALVRLESGETEEALISLRQFIALYPKHEMSGGAIFLLAAHGDEQARQRYFDEILQRYPGQVLFDAALAAQQYHDYQNSGFQEMVNRSARLTEGDSLGRDNRWQRLQHLLLAEAAYYLDQVALARREYERASGRHGIGRHWLEAVTELDEVGQLSAQGTAWCLLKSGQLDSAAVLFERLNLLGGELSIRTAFGLATVYFRQKQFEEAIRTYPITRDSTVAPELRGLFARAQYRIAECYYRLEYYTQANENWQQVADRFPESDLAPEALFRVADTYFRANHFDESVSVLQALRMKYPDHQLAVQSLLRIAQAKFNAGEYEAAVADFEQFARDFPEHEGCKDALEGIQLCYYQMGQSGQASEALEQLIARSPDGALSADARFRLAQSYADAGRYEQAVAAFKEILTRHPGTSYASDAQFALAQTMFAQQDYTAATAEFARFLEYFPDNPQSVEARFNLGVCYFNQQSYLSASDHFLLITQNHPDCEFYAHALQNAGWCYERLGEQENAVRYLSQYLRENPQADDRQKIKLHLGSLAAETGKWQEAITFFKELRASQDTGIATEAAYRLATVYMERQNWQAARQALKDAITKGDSNDFYRLNAMSQLAAMYENEQDWRKAVALYKLLADDAPEERWRTAAQERIQALSPMLAEVTN